MILNEYLINKIINRGYGSFFNIDKRKGIKELKIDEIHEIDLKKIGLNIDEIIRCISKIKHGNKWFYYFFEINENIDVIKLNDSDLYEDLNEVYLSSDDSDSEESDEYCVDYNEILFYNLENNRLNIVRFLLKLSNNKIVITNINKISRIFECNNIEIVKMFISKLNIEKICKDDKIEMVILSFKYRDLELSESLIEFIENIKNNDYLRFYYKAIKNNFGQILNSNILKGTKKMFQKLASRFYFREKLNINTSIETSIWILNNLNKNSKWRSFNIVKKLYLNSDLETLEYLLEKKYFIPEEQDIIDILYSSAKLGKIDIMQYIDNKYFSKISYLPSDIMKINLKIEKESLFEEIIYKSLDQYWPDSINYIFKKHCYFKKRRKINNNDLFFIDKCVKRVLVNYKNYNKMECIELLYKIDKNIKVHCENEEPITIIIEDNDIKLAKFLIRIDSEINLNKVENNLSYSPRYNKIIEDLKKYQKSYHKNLN